MYQVLIDIQAIHHDKPTLEATSQAMDDQSSSYPQHQRPIR